MATMSGKLYKAIFDIMSDGEMYDLVDIKEQIQQRNGWVYKVDYTEGQISSVMRRFRRDGILEQLERGSYRKSSDALEHQTSDVSVIPLIDEFDYFSVCQKVIYILKEQYMYLSKLMKKKTVDSLNERDVEMIKVVWKLKNELEGILDENHILTEDLNP